VQQTAQNNEDNLLLMCLSLHFLEKDKIMVPLKLAEQFFCWMDYDD